MESVCQKIEADVFLRGKTNPALPYPEIRPKSKAHQWDWQHLSFHSQGDMVSTPVRESILGPVISYHRHPVYFVSLKLLGCFLILTTGIWEIILAFTSNYFWFTCITTFPDKEVCSFSNTPNHLNFIIWCSFSPSILSQCYSSGPVIKAVASITPCDTFPIWIQEKFSALWHVERKYPL